MRIWRYDLLSVLVHLAVGAICVLRRAGDDRLGAFSKLQESELPASQKFASAEAALDSVDIQLRVKRLAKKSSAVDGRSHQCAVRADLSFALLRDLQSEAVTGAEL